jgi:hypothetical protein
VLLRIQNSNLLIQKLTFYQLSYPDKTRKKEEWSVLVKGLVPMCNYIKNILYE